VFHSWEYISDLGFCGKGFLDLADDPRPEIVVPGESFRDSRRSGYAIVQHEYAVGSFVNPWLRHADRGTAEQGNLALQFRRIGRLAVSTVERRSSRGSTSRKSGIAGILPSMRWQFHLFSFPENSLIPNKNGSGDPFHQGGLEE